MNKKIITGFLVISLLFLIVLTVRALPTFMILNGSVKINNLDAPPGTVIKAYIQNDDDPSVEDATLTITTPGKYDNLIMSYSSFYLGSQVTFTINDFNADQTTTLQDKGIITLDLTADTIPVPQTCSDQSGFICSLSEICSGIWLSASDTNRCCSVSCTTPQPKPQPNFTELDACKNNPIGNLTVKIKEPDKNDEFKINEIIETEVKVKNNEKTDLDVIVEAILYDTTDNKEIKTVDSKSKTIGNNEEKIFEFDLKIPSDKEIEKNDDIILFVKAYAENSEEQYCTEDFVEIDIERESHDVIIDKISNPSVASCNDLVNFKVDIDNIGTKKQENVYVTLINNELNLNEKSNYYNLEDYENGNNDETINFHISIPETAKEKDYQIEATVHFDDDSKTESEFTTLTITDCIIPTKITPLPVTKTGKYVLQFGQTTEQIITKKSTTILDKSYFLPLLIAADLVLFILIILLLIKI